MPNVSTGSLAPRIEIASSALNDLLLHGADYEGQETGGILLGHDVDGRGVISIAAVGGPGPKAERSPTHFRRDLEYSEELAAHSWDASRNVWVGEWHTHPGSLVAPSDFDMDVYLGFFMDDALRFDVFVSLVLLRDERTAEISVRGWIVTPEGPKKSTLLVVPRA